MIIRLFWIVLTLNIMYISEKKQPISMPSDSDESADSSESGKGGKMKAFLWCREESYGYTKGKYTNTYIFL